MPVSPDRSTLVLAFGILGNIVSVAVYFAPWSTFRRIIREKSTMGFKSEPYVVALFSATLWLYYGLLQMVPLLISINAVGCVIQTVYILLFVIYSSTNSRKRLLKLVSAFNVGVFCAIFVLSEFVLKQHSLQVQVVGWICVAFSVSVFVAPLGIVFQVVRTKSAEFMPVTLSVALTISAVMWFFYGLLARDLCVALPNILGFFLGTIQVLLWWVYRKSKTVTNDSENSVKKSPIPIVLSERDNVIDILVLENSDPVHPMAISDPVSSDTGEISLEAKTDDDRIKKESDGDEAFLPGGVALPASVTVMHIESPVLVECQA